MFDKLDDLLIRFEEVLNELGEPAEFQAFFRGRRSSRGRPKCRRSRRDGCRR